jgi:uncharacterized DUF497 family protein
MVAPLHILAGATGFEWDEGNDSKSLEKHGVEAWEAEQVFSNGPRVALARNDAGELRYAALGKSDAGRELAVVFTLRGTLIRVISARPMSRKERQGSPP